jgi:hypothetical protein
MAPRKIKKSPKTRKSPNRRKYPKKYSAETSQRLVRQLSFEDLNNENVTGLRALARGLEIAKYNDKTVSQLNKKELVDAIHSKKPFINKTQEYASKIFKTSPNGPVKQELEKMSVSDLRKTARKYDILEYNGKKVANMKKSELVDAIYNNNSFISELVPWQKSPKKPAPKKHEPEATKEKQRTPRRQDLEKMTVVKLRKLAKSLNIVEYKGKKAYHMNKKELVDAIHSNKSFVEKARELFG